MGPWWRVFRTWRIHVLLDASTRYLRMLVRDLHRSSGNPVFMRVKTNPPPFTMRLCPSFVNRKTDICSVFGLFFQDFSQFHRFSLDLCPFPYKPNNGRRFFSRPASSGVFNASTSGAASWKHRITSLAKLLCRDFVGASVASTPHWRHKSRSIAG